MVNLYQFIKKNKGGFLRLLIGAAIIAGVYLFDYQCIFLKYFHIPCLGCGMSRAWMTALHGRLKEAFEYHKAFFTIPILGVYLFKGSLFKNKTWNVILISVISLGFIINYISHFIRI